MKKNKFIKIWPYFISIILLILLFRELENYNFIESLGQINSKIILVSLGMFFVAKLINTFRYAGVYKIKQKTNLFFGLSFCNFMLTLIPFRLGEYSYIQYLKNKFEVKREEGVSKLLLIRFFDYVVAYLFFVLASFFITLNNKNSVISSEFQGNEAVFYVSFFTLLALIISFFVVIFVSKINFIDNKIFKKIIEIIKTFKQEFSFDKKNFFIRIFILSGIYWSVRFLGGFIIFNMLGVNMGIFLFVFISLFILLIDLLPIKAFAGFGMFEGGWAYFLVLAGFEYERVLPIIVNFHLVTLLPILVYGIIGFLFLKFKK